MITISCINNKGGVGKTTAVVNLAHCLANRGKKVLVIDQDSQCNSSDTLSPQHTKHRKALYDYYSGNTSNAHDCIHATKYQDVDIIPNIPDTAVLERKLYTNYNTSQELIRGIVSQVRGEYDYVFIDCPPTLGLWVIQALVASDCAIVPIQAGSKYSIDGLLSAIEVIKDVAREANPSLKFLRLLINLVDLRTSIDKASIDFIRSRFGDDMMFKTNIPENTQIKQAESNGVTVIRHNPQCAGSKRFRDLAEELIQLTEGMKP